MRILHPHSRSLLPWLRPRSARLSSPRAARKDERQQPVAWSSGARGPGAQVRARARGAGAQVRRALRERGRRKGAHKPGTWRGFPRSKGSVHWGWRPRSAGLTLPRRRAAPSAPPESVGQGVGGERCAPRGEERGQGPQVSMGTCLSAGHTQAGLLKGQGGGISGSRRLTLTRVCTHIGGLTHP